MLTDDYILRSDAVFALCENCEMTEACGITGDLCGDVKRIEAIPAADVEPKREWIPVTERLPERGTEVLTAIYGTDLIVQEEGESLEDAVRRARSGPGRVEMGYLDQDGIWTEILFGAPMMVLPRYWMPLPEPPKEEEDNDHKNL